MYRDVGMPKRQEMAEAMLGDSETQLSPSHE